LSRWCFILLFLNASSLQAGPTPAAMETPAPKANPEGTAASDPVENYSFHSDTAWGHVEVGIQALQNSFHGKVECDSGLSGWILEDEKSGSCIAKGGVNPAALFQFQVHRPFQGPYRLTLFLHPEDEEVPVALTLRRNTESRPGVPASPETEDYRENPDHPYDLMVKSLYERAVAAYSRGDSPTALDLLDKARELDGTQPQILALLVKIKGPDVPNLDSLESIRACLKKGNREEAAAKLGDYLRDHPDDDEALKLEDEIDGGRKARSEELLRRAKNAEESGETDRARRLYQKALKFDPQNRDARDALARLHSPSKPKTATPALSDADRQAQADQAYNLGLDSYRQGDYAAAAKFWQETLQILPTHLQARRNLERLKEEHPGLP
jgi:tetratricopeptide (TPR) repeat protein